MIGWPQGLVPFFPNSRVDLSDKCHELQSPWRLLTQHFPVTIVVGQQANHHANTVTYYSDSWTSGLSVLLIRRCAGCFSFWPRCRRRRTAGPEASSGEMASAPGPAIKCLAFPKVRRAGCQRPDVGVPLQAGCIFCCFRPFLGAEKSIGPEKGGQFLLDSLGRQKLVVRGFEREEKCPGGVPEPGRGLS